MFLANQLNWHDGVPETSMADVTDWSFQPINSQMTLCRMALCEFPFVAFIQRAIQDDGPKYASHLIFNGARDIQSFDSLDEAFTHIQSVQDAVQWVWADKAVGFLRSSLHVPIQWQDENGIWAARTPNYYATATAETGTLTIYMQGERMFYRRVAGSSAEEVKQQVQDLLNQKRFEVGQLVEEL